MVFVSCAWSVYMVGGSPYYASLPTVWLISWSQGHATEKIYWYWCPMTIWHHEHGGLCCKLEESITTKTTKIYVHSYATPTPNEYALVRDVHTNLGHLPMPNSNYDHVSTMVLSSNWSHKTVFHFHFSFVVCCVTTQQWYEYDIRGYIIRLMAISNSWQWCRCSKSLVKAVCANRSVGGVE